MTVVKQSFLNVGVPDGVKLDKIAHTLLELYGTTGNSINFKICNFCMHALYKIEKNPFPP